MSGAGRPAPAQRSRQVAKHTIYRERTGAGRAPGLPPLQFTVSVPIGIIVVPCTLAAQRSLYCFRPGSMLDALVDVVINVA